jgi:hypothetical protein
MATVQVGRRWEQSQGDYSFHCGTLDYLAKIKAEPVLDTTKEVPDYKLGPEGEYNDA